MHSYYESPQPDDVFDKVGFHVPTMVSIHKQISMISHNTSYMILLVYSMHESFSELFCMQCHNLTRDYATDACA